MESSKQHSLLSLIFILNCLPKSSVIRIKVIIIMMMILIKLIIIIIIIIRLRENGKKAIRLKPGFHISGKSQTIGDFTVSRLSQILPTNENSKS